MPQGTIISSVSLLANLGLQYCWIFLLAYQRHSDIAEYRNSIELVRSLVDELESKLLSIAEYTDNISKNRTLCDQWERFQSQDALTVFRPFLHSQDFSALLLSASNGCHLCEHLVDAQNRLKDSDQRHYSIESLADVGEGPQVILQIARAPWHELWVSCNGKTAKIDL